MIVVILAGGEGTRMGGVDKGAIELGSTRMIDVVSARVKNQGADLKISGRHDYGLGVDVISDLEAGPKGPVAGIYAAFQALQRTSDIGFFTVPVDGPNVPNDLLSRLYHAEFSAVARDDIGLHPVFAWWRFEDLRSLWTRLDFKDSISMKYLVEVTQAKPVKWAGSELFANINTANDLANYLNKP